MPNPIEPSLSFNAEAPPTAGEKTVAASPRNIHELTAILTEFLNGITPLTTLIINYYYSSLDLSDHDINFFIRSLILTSNQTQAITPALAVPTTVAATTMTAATNAMSEQKPNPFEDVEITLLKQQKLAVNLLVRALEIIETNLSPIEGYEALLVSCFRSFITRCFEFETITGFRNFVLNEIKDESQTKAPIYNESKLKNSEDLLKNNLLLLMDDIRGYLPGFIRIFVDSYRKLLTEGKSQNAEEMLFLIQVMLTLGYHNKVLEINARMGTMIDCAMASDIPKLLKFIVPQDLWFSYIHRGKHLAEDIVLQAKHQRNNILEKFVEILQNNPLLKLNAERVIQIIKEVRQTPLETINQYRVRTKKLVQEHVSYKKSWRRNCIIVLAMIIFYFWYMGKKAFTPALLFILIPSIIATGKLLHANRPIDDGLLTMNQTTKDLEEKILIDRHVLKAKTDPILERLLQLLNSKAQLTAASATASMITPIAHISDSKYSLPTPIAGTAALATERSAGSKNATSLAVVSAPVPTYDEKAVASWEGDEDSDEKSMPLRFRSTNSGSSSQAMTASLIATASGSAPQIVVNVSTRPTNRNLAMSRLVIVAASKTQTTNMPSQQPKPG